MIRGNAPKGSFLCSFLGRRGWHTWMGWVYPPHGWGQPMKTHHGAIPGCAGCTHHMGGGNPLTFSMVPHLDGLGVPGVLLH